MSKQIAVLGMGRFGKSIALSLADMGADVMAVDANPDVLEKISDIVFRTERRRVYPCFDSV